MLLKESIITDEKVLIVKVIYIRDINGETSRYWGNSWSQVLKYKGWRSTNRISIVPTSFHGVSKTINNDDSKL